MRLFRVAYGKFQDLTLLKKLWLLVAFVTVATLGSFAWLTSVQTKKMMTDREGRMMAQQIEYFTGSMNSYFESVQKSAQILIYSDNIQHRLRTDVNALVGEERIKAYNEIYGQLQHMRDNVYGIESIHLIDHFGVHYYMNLEMASVMPGLNNEKDGISRLAGPDSSSIWRFVRKNDASLSVVYVTPINSKSDLSLLGYLAVSISPRIFDTFLKASNLGEGINSITDRSGLVYSTGAQWKELTSLDLTSPGLEAESDYRGYRLIRHNGEPYMVAYSKHKLTGWTFLHSVPQSIVLKDLRTINRMWVLFLAISLLLMMAVSVPISRTITGPLRRMVRLLREVERGNLNGRFPVQQKDELGLLGHSFNQMLTKVQEGIPLIREKFVRSLLESVMSQEELCEYERRLGFAFRPEEPVQVVLLHLAADRNEGSLHSAKVAIGEWEATAPMITGALSSNQFCLIMNCCQEKTLMLLNRWMEELADRYGIGVYAFFGHTYDHVHFINNSFEEARALLKYHLCDSMSTENAVFLPSDSWQHQYPETFENRLVYYMEEGDFEKCSAVMEELIAFARSNNVAPRIMNSFLAAMYNHLNKLTIKYGDPADQTDEDWLGKLNVRLSLEPLEKNCRDFVVLLRRKLNGRRLNTARHSANIVKALQVIREQYASTELGADYVARSLGLNPNYFSQQFKKEVGTGFTEYVSGVRLEHAKRLLEEPGVKVKDVAKSAGFTDPHYFGVWFKENTGLSPSLYRKRITAAAQSI